MWCHTSCSLLAHEHNSPCNTKYLSLCCMNWEHVSGCIHIHCLVLKQADEQSGCLPKLLFIGEVARLRGLDKITCTFYCRIRWWLSMNYFRHCSFVSRAIIPQFLVQTYRTPSCAFTELLSIVKLLCFLPSFLWQIDNWVDKIRWHRKCMAITVNLQLEMLDIMFLLMTITTFMTITTLMTAARNAGRQCFSVTPGGQQVIFCSSALWSGFCTYSNCWIMAGISATVRIQTSTAIVTLYVRQIYVYT